MKLKYATFCCLIGITCRSTTTTTTTTKASSPEYSLDTDWLRIDIGFNN